MTAVFLDVDGTIVDSNVHHVIAWQRAFRDVDRDVASTTLLPLMGMGGDHLVAEIFDDDAETSFGDEVRDAHDRYFEQMMAWIRPLPGARELVEALLRRDVQVVLATSSGIDHVREHAELVGLDLDRLTFVTAEDLEHTKPSPDVYLTALEKTGLDRAEAIVIGDAIWDVRAGTAAGIASIAIPSAGGQSSKLTEVGAVAVYADAFELRDDLDAALALAGTGRAQSHA
ncbi:MAG: family hydrolase [Thermoleophilia bacterium]|nr:family hydrolase [Thermoleophilia bacterium]